MDRRSPEEIPKKIPRLSSTPPPQAFSSRPNILGLPQGNRVTTPWRWDEDAASKLVVPTQEPICGHRSCNNAQERALRICERYQKLVKKFSRQENRIRKALEEKANYERELLINEMVADGRGDQEVAENEEADVETVGEEDDGANQNHEEVEEDAGESDGDEVDY
jgi:hypothetical protein